MSRRHPFDAHMATAPLWVKVVSRTGVAITFVGFVVLVLAYLGVGPNFQMFAAAIYLWGFGVLVAVVAMAFHPRRRR
ncbi:MAG TPA: hypothetical protein VF821_29385 [Lentzea sp.]